MAGATGAITKDHKKKNQTCPCVCFFFSNKATAMWIHIYIADIWTDIGFDCFDTKAEKKKKSPKALATCYSEWLSFRAGAQSGFLRRSGLNSVLSLCNTQHCWQVPPTTLLTQTPKHIQPVQLELACFCVYLFFSKCVSQVIDVLSVKNCGFYWVELGSNIWETDVISLS